VSWFAALPAAVSEQGSQVASALRAMFAATTMLRHSGSECGLTFRSTTEPLRRLNDRS
jgi:hypothetical protein